jgi:hypothetical protein
MPLFGQSGFRLRIRRDLIPIDAPFLETFPSGLRLEKLASQQIDAADGQSLQNGRHDIHHIITAATHMKHQAVAIIRFTDVDLDRPAISVDPAPCWVGKIGGRDNFSDSIDHIASLSQNSRLEIVGYIPNRRNVRKILNVNIPAHSALPPILGDETANLLGSNPKFTTRVRANSRAASNGLGRIGELTSVASYSAATARSRPCVEAR